MKRVTFVLAALLLLAMGAVSQAQQTPEMPDAVAQFWKRIDEAEDAELYRQSVEAGIGRPSWAAPGKSVFYVDSTYEIKVRRPNRISIVRTPGTNQFEITENGQTHAGFDNFGPDVYVSDGRKGLSYDTYIRSYTIDKAPKSLGDARLSKGSDGYYMWFHQAMDWFFDEHPLEGYKRAPDAKMTTFDCAVYLLENPAQPKLQDGIFISTSRPGS